MGKTYIAIYKPNTTEFIDLCVKENDCDSDAYCTCSYIPQEIDDLEYFKRKLLQGIGIKKFPECKEIQTNIMNITKAVVEGR